MQRAEIIAAIIAERSRQDQEHPEFPADMRMAILSEETGEVGRAIQNKDQDNLREELVQVAAAAIRWLECMGNDRS